MSDYVNPFDILLIVVIIAIALGLYGAVCLKSDQYNSADSFTYKEDSDRCFDNAIFSWERHTVLNIEYIPSIDYVNDRICYTDNRVKEYKYPVSDIGIIIELETGETVGTNLDLLQIGTEYDMKIYRGVMRGENVAWSENCRYVVGGD